MLRRDDASPESRAAPATCVVASTMAHAIRSGSRSWTRLVEQSSGNVQRAGRRSTLVVRHVAMPRIEGIERIGKAFLSVAVDSPEVHFRLERLATIEVDLSCALHKVGACGVRSSLVPQTAGSAAPH